MTRRALLVALLLWLPALPLAAEPRTLEVKAVDARPARLLASGRALVHLSVTLRNLSPRTLDGFSFEVEVDGRTLPVYQDTMFLGYALPPGRTDTVPLYNFWVQGAGRHVVRVRVVEACSIVLKGRDEKLEERIPLEVTATREITVRP